MREATKLVKTLHTFDSIYEFQNTIKQPKQWQETGVKHVVL